MKEGDTDSPGEGMAAHPDPQASELDALLGACQDIASEHLTKLQQRVLQALGELSDECNDNGQGSLFLEGMRSIHLEKDVVTAKFQEAFARRFQQSSRPNARVLSREQEEGSTGDELCLVNEQELEESLAVDHLIAKVHDCFHDDLFALEQRFSYLLPQALVASDTIPLGPESLCYAFQDAHRHLGLDIGVKLYLYKVFDRVLMEALGPFYHAVNQLLIGRGILPKLKIRVKKNSNGKDREEARQESPVSAGKGITSGGAQVALPIQAQMFQALQYLLNVQFNSSAASEDIGDAGTPIAALPATPLLVDTLSDLQHNLSAQSPPDENHAGTLNLKEQLAQRIGHQGGGGQPARLNQIDDETIDVISMIFDYILDDRSLPDFIKALIARLQIPVLKVAIIDRAFFSRKSHPARQLLNDLAYAGVGWLDESEAAKDRLYEKMEAIVLRVLHEFDSDITIFDELLTEFRSFVEEEKKNFIAAQEEVRQQTFQREQCNKQIAALLATRLQDRSIPSDVREFLMTSWRQVITEISLRDGLDSPEGQKALQVMDDLIWSLSPHAGGEERRKLILILPLMLEALRDGLQAIGYQEQDIDTVMDMLGQHHLRIIKADHHDMPATTQMDSDGKADSSDDDIDQLIRNMNADIEELPELGSEDLDITADLKGPLAEGGQGSFAKIMAEMGFQQETDSGPRIDDQYTGLVRDLALGTWLELEEGGNRIRVKLAWKGDEFTNYSFMNRQYKVVAERPLYVLAEEFRQGRASLIEDVALFDRALDGVISGIMKFTR